MRNVTIFTRETLANQTLGGFGLRTHRRTGVCDHKTGACSQIQRRIGKTIRLITQDKKRAWICEIKLTFVPSWSQMRLQLLHFHAVFKTWLTFQELTSINSFRRRRWSERDSGENRNIQGNQRNDMLNKIRGLVRNFFLPPDVAVAVLVCLRSLIYPRSRARELEIRIAQMFPCPGDQRDYKYWESDKYIFCGNNVELPLGLNSLKMKHFLLGPGLRGRGPSLKMGSVCFYYFYYYYFFSRCYKSALLKRWLVDSDHVSLLNLWNLQN